MTTRPAVQAALAVFLATAAVAQTPVSIRIVSGSITAAAGSVVRRGTTGSVHAADRHAVHACSATGSAQAGVRGLTASVAAQAMSTGRCGQGPFAFGMQGSGSARMVVRLSAPTPTAGVLTIDSRLPFGSVDVGNDRRGESPGTLPIVVDATGIEIALSASASAVAPFVPGASTWARIAFSPTPAGLDTDLTPCGPELAGWKVGFANGAARLELRAHRSTSGAGYFVFGLTRQRVVLPPLGCVLGTDIALPVPAVIRPNGDASLTLTLPAPVPRVTVHAQYLVGVREPRGDVWRTSNRLTVTLP